MTIAAQKLVTGPAEVVAGRALRYALVPVDNVNLAAFDVLRLASFDDRVLRAALGRIEHPLGERGGHAGHAAIGVLERALAMVDPSEVGASAAR